MMFVSTGSRILDDFLGGGLRKKMITHIYGPAGSGKTNICLQASVFSALSGKNVVYIDTEGGFTVERIKQLTDRFRDVLSRIRLFEATTFREQSVAFTRLPRAVSQYRPELIVVDSMGALYRLELAEEDPEKTNAELARQVHLLLHLARKNNLAVLVSNQVYTLNGKNYPVSGDILRYASKVIVELRREGEKRKAVLIKHPFLPEGREVEFVITEKGIMPA